MFFLQIIIADLLIIQLRQLLHQPVLMLNWILCLLWMALAVYVTMTRRSKMAGAITGITWVAFIENIVNFLGVGRDASRVGLLTFANEADVKWTLDR